MTKPIDAMTPEELVAAVATEALGWPSRSGCHHRVPGTATEFQADRLWRPLESWDGAMIVVEAMREKGWMVQLSDRQGETLIGFVSADASFMFQSTTHNATAQRTAILRAALAACREGK